MSCVPSPVWCCTYGDGQSIRDRELALERERAALLNEGSTIHRQASDYVARTAALNEKEKVRAGACSQADGVCWTASE